jgi:hypothetical protein
MESSASWIFLRKKPSFNCGVSGSGKICSNQPTTIDKKGGMKAWHGILIYKTPFSSTLMALEGLGKPGGFS